MDRFDNLYFNYRFPDPQNRKPEIYSTCAGCRGDIYVGEVVLDIFGMSVHDEKECVLKAVDAQRKIAEKDRSV